MMKQSDAKLNGKLREEMYMKVPEAIKRKIQSKNQNYTFINEFF